MLCEIIFFEGVKLLLKTKRGLQNVKIERKFMK